MSVSDNLDPIVASALATLDRLSPSDIQNLDDSCPICLLTFRAVLEPREDNPQGKAVSGVARVGGCGHLFCVEDLSEWIKGRHGTCPTCRHDFLPELRPVDSDAESDDDGDYVPTEYEADSDLETDYEDGFMDSDGIDVDAMDIDTLLHVAGGEEAIEGDERESIASSHPFPGYHESHDLGGTNEWGLMDGDSMGTREGELSVGDRFLETNVQVRLDSEEEYAIYEDGEEPKC
ncbi:hypothetical protein F5888DRAFT_1798807 [Russula emetica]|nr:hypothetical protein F5888DRAFT_1798807 [Russula emetica]